MTCVWDAANKSANITLTRADTCATSMANNGVWKGVRGTTSQSTGKKYLEVTQGYLINNSIITGFGNSSFNTANYPGSDGNSFGFQANFNGVYGVAAGWTPPTHMGEIIQLAIDLDAKLVWARTDRQSNWNNSGTANPATGTGGKSYTVTGALFPALGLAGASAATQTNWANINAGAFTFSGAIPSGFSAWDTGTPSGTGIGGTSAPTTWDAGTKGANITLTQPNLQASQSNLNNTWNSVISTSKYNSGQVYFELQILSYDNQNGILFGLSDGSASTSTYIGAASFAFGYQFGFNYIITQNQNSNTTGAPFWQGAIVPQYLGCAVDFNRGLMWVKNLNASPGYWNNDSVGDPVAGLRGMAIPPGDLYIAFSGLSNTAADTVVLNTGVSPFIGTAPSGYSAWDSAGGTGATAQATSLEREVLLADTGTVAVDSITREVLLTDTAMLQVGALYAEALIVYPAALQVSGIYGEVLRSTRVWTPYSMPQGLKYRAYRIR